MNFADLKAADFVIRIEHIRTLAGVNVNGYQPMILMRLNLENLNNRESREFNDFDVRLLDLLPGLAGHQCRLGKPGGFCRQLVEGTDFGYVVERAALELMTVTGIGKSNGKTRYAGETGIYNVAVEYEAEQAARFLLEKAVHLVESLLENKPFPIAEIVAQAQEIAADTEPGPSGRSIVTAAEPRGIPWKRLGENSLVQLEYGKSLHFAQAAETDLTSNIAVGLASDKDATKRRLIKFSIPVPRGEIVRTEQEALAALARVGAPVVVKPLDGRQGKGVSMNLKTPAEVVAAFKIAQEFSSAVLIEELFEGSNYRALVVNGNMVAAAERLPCLVTGDGVCTVEQLIERENQNPLRGEGHEKPLTRITVNQIMLATLEKSGWKMSDVPAADEQVTLCAGMNLSTGGTAKDVTDEVHPQIKTMCERAARVIGLDICGVDLVVKNIAAPPDGSGGIIELNAAPGLRMHLFPNEGEPRDVGGAIIEMLYPNDAESRIPIIAVTGTNGKTTVTRMISHVLQETNLNIGTTTTDGIYLNGEMIAMGDTTGPVSAATILGDKAIDIAVLETARGGIIRRGLGWDWCDVAVITNITADHLGQDGIESVDDLVWIKSLIAERVKAGGTLVLNADDAMSASLAERAAVKRIEKKIVYFAHSENNPIVSKHLAAGGTAFFLRENRIVEAHGNESAEIADARDIPATMNGAAVYQIENALAATAACRAHGVLPGKIRAALTDFQSNLKNPGRSNFYQVGSGHALLDYGHNPAAFAAICQTAANWKNQRVTGIIGVPGDRNNSIIEAAGRIAAQGFDRIIVKEDADTRGRERGEAARLLCEAVMKNNRDGRECSIVTNETAAFERELQNLRANEIVVLFYDKLAPALEVLQKYDAAPVNDLVAVQAKTEPQHNFRHRPKKSMRAARAII